MIFYECDECDPLGPKKFGEKNIDSSQIWGPKIFWIQSRGLLKSVKSVKTFESSEKV